MMDDTFNETGGDNDDNHRIINDPEEADDPTSVTSSNMMEVGSTAGEDEDGYNLRRRVYDVKGVLRAFRTPSPSPSRSFPEEKDLVSSKSRFHKKAGRSFAELSKEYEEKEKLTKLGVDTSNKKTMEDYIYKGVANKRNVHFSLQGRFSEMIRRLPLGPTLILNILYAAFAIIMVSGMLYFFATIQQEDIVTMADGSVSLKSAQKIILQRIQKLSLQFPSQNKETMVHLISAVNSTLDLKEPKQPSSITILIPPSMKSSSFPACFARKFGSLVNLVFSKVTNLPLSTIHTFDNPYFGKYGEEITEIHKQLNDYFAKGGKAVLVQDIEKITQEKHILIFHSLCDNYKAPEKRATIFFLVHVPEAIYKKWNWSQKYAAHISNDALEITLQNVISDDSRPAIIARIAASVVLLNPGDSCSTD